MYLSLDSSTWHSDRTCETIAESPQVQERTVDGIMNAGDMYLACWLADIRMGPCRLCTPTIWDMVRRQNPVLADPEV